MLSARMSDRPPKPPSRSAPRANAASMRLFARASSASVGPCCTQFRDHPVHLLFGPRGLDAVLDRGRHHHQARELGGDRRRRSPRWRAPGRRRGARSSRALRDPLSTLAKSSSRCELPRARRARDTRGRYAPGEPDPASPRECSRRAAAPIRLTRASGGEDGMPPKYLVTSSTARSGVMSPASESTQLFGP